MHKKPSRLTRHDLLKGGLAVGGAAAALSLAGAAQASTSIEVVDTITDLKNLDPATAANNQFVFVSGFDQAGDGCGGAFYWRSGSRLPTSPGNTLNGVAMNSNDGSLNGHWLRHHEGPLHTRWAGIKPADNPSGFNLEGYGANNRARWNALNAFCARQLWDVLVSGKADVVANAIYVDPGIHDFANGTLNKSQGVPIIGAGPLVSVLRTNQGAGVFVQAGDPGDRLADSTLESAGDEVIAIGIIHFSKASTLGTGIAFDNTIRQSSLRRCWIEGFETNVDINAFGFEVEDCSIIQGYNFNLKVGPSTNSLNIEGNRIDRAISSSVGRLVQIEGGGGAVNIRIVRNELQSAERIALLIKDVATLEIRANQFEANNKDGAYHPDIWLEGVSLRNAIIDGNYFTATGRNGTTTSRAISIRSNVTANARCQISNNNVFGDFDRFIDVNSNVAMEIVEYNNVHNSTSAFPPNVVVKTFP
ncbi:MAG: hypothetical protein AAFX54_14320 [Pseudomonadota bacterium]